LKEIDADGLVLSGGAPRLGLASSHLGNCTDYLNEFQGPILGICVGLHFMALHCGGSVGPARLPEYGLAKIRVLEEDDLFKGLPKEFSVWESHNDEVKKAPGFRVLAVSDNCSVQAMKQKFKPHYGVQFHPEVNDTEHGAEILGNFLEVVRSRRERA
jgi:GMP synthase (glutamine-hydrolysing)